jgi:hypothetical protein
MAGLTANLTRLGSKRAAGMAICLIALAGIYFGFSVGGESPKKLANASAQRHPTAVKPVQAMNLALGNMVVLARDMGFDVKTAKDASFESNKVGLRIESHLQKLREIYRQESAQNAALVGSVTLQFNVSPRGEVSQVSEISSRITDGEFKNAIVGEVAKWSFADLAPEPLVVTCPLLFVREGMDITTLMHWEKSFATGGEKIARPVDTEKAAPVVAAKKDAPKAEPKVIPSMAANEAEIKYSTSLLSQC